MRKRDRRIAKKEISTEERTGEAAGRKPFRMRRPCHPRPLHHHCLLSFSSPLPGLIEPPWLNSSGIHKAPSLTPTSPALSVMDGMRGLGPLWITIPVIFCEDTAFRFSWGVVEINREEKGGRGFDPHFSLYLPL